LYKNNLCLKIPVSDQHDNAVLNSTNHNPVEQAMPGTIVSITSEVLSGGGMYLSNDLCQLWAF